jgi:hypothetical protein
MLSYTWTASLGLTYTIIRSYPPGPTPLGDGSYGDESYKGRIVQGTYDLWKITRVMYNCTYGDASSRHPIMVYIHTIGGSGKLVENAIAERLQNI